jgi:hypothetical protein
MHGCQHKFCSALHITWSRSTLALLFFNFPQTFQLSSPAESHRQALPEPDVNLSIHPAPSVQPLTNGLVLSMQVLPSRVAHGITPNDAAPSVRSHYRTFFPTTSDSAPVPRLGTQALAGAPRLRGSLCIGTTGSYVPHPCLNQDHAAFMPDASGAINRSSSTSFAGQSLDPGFDVGWGLSTRHQRFTCVRLLDSHLTKSCSAFSGNAHDDDS